MLRITPGSWGFRKKHGLYYPIDFRPLLRQPWGRRVFARGPKRPFIEAMKVKTWSVETPRCCRCRTCAICKELHTQSERTQEREVCANGKVQGAEPSKLLKTQEQRIHGPTGFDVCPTGFWYYFGSVFPVSPFLHFGMGMYILQHCR